MRVFGEREEDSCKGEYYMKEYDKYSKVCWQLGCIYPTKHLFNI